MKRTMLALAGAAVLTLSACGGGSEAAGGGEGSLTVGCSALVTQVPRAVAQDAGFFGDEGVDPKCIEVASGPELSAALLSGDVNVTFMNPVQVAGLIEKDQSIKAVGMIWDANTFDVLVSRDFPIAEGAGWKEVVQDMEGAKIGVVSLGGAGEAVARGLLSEAGVDPDSATYIATGLVGPTLAALAGGSIDVAVTLEPGITQAVQEGIGKAPFSLNDGTGPESLDYADLMMVASEEWAKANSETLCGFLDGWSAGFEKVQDEGSRDEVVAVTEEFLGVDAGTASALLESNTDNYPTDTSIDADRLAPAFQFLKDNGLAAEAYGPEAYALDVCS